ncbi:MAG TPA: TIR domain-containing protein [Rhizomicrobium sp.]|jgi:hypothetical protein
MARKRIFISYDHENDARYKNLLHAWNKHNDFDLQIYNGSLHIAINSQNAAYVKSQIRPMITWCSYLLCLIGEDTHKSAWIDWEINTAVENDKRLIAVKITKDCISPPAIMNRGATWALSFNYEAIKKAIDGA